MALREILAYFGVEFDSTEIDKGNDSIGSAISKLKGLAAVVAGSALVVGIQNLVGEVRQQSLALSELSGQVNISTADLQQWQFVGQSLTVSNQDTSTSFVELAKRIGDAATKGGDAAKVFSDLNVEIKDGERIRSTAEVFEELRGALGGLASEADQVSKAEALFGGAGRKILPLLKATSEEVSGLSREFQELGGGIQEDTIKTFQEMERENAKLDFAMMGLKSNIAGSVLPVFRFLTDGATLAAKTFNDLTKGVDTTQLALVALGVAAVIAGVMFGAAFLPVLIPVAKAALVVAALIAITDDLITAYRGGRSTIAVFWKEWTSRNLAEDLHTAVNAADRLFTVFKGMARIAGFLVGSIAKIPQTLGDFKATQDYKAESEKLDRLLKMQRQLQAGEKPVGFTKRDKELVANPELLEQDIQAQTAVVEEKRKGFTKATDNAESDTRFGDLFDSFEKDADAMNERIRRRDVDGKAAGEKSEKNIADYYHRLEEEKAGSSLPRAGETETDRVLREQERAEADLAGGLDAGPRQIDDFSPQQFEAFDSKKPDADQLESLSALVESNTALAEGSDKLQSTYTDAAQKTDQLASMTRDNTSAVRDLANTLRAQEAAGLTVDNLNVYMQPGEGAREAGERAGQELQDALRSAMSSG